MGRGYVPNLVQRCITFSIANNGVFLEHFEDFPAPVSIYRIFHYPPHDEGAFNRLWTVQVVRNQRLDDEVILPILDFILACKDTVLGNGLRQIPSASSQTISEELRVS
ncbi:hypothetical protein ETB97_005491 [Aspergillus alliaceus]|uniref:Uncharacterized protein n=1 Tax=Petromyces alliaceus TaxID=209559 RepID=A0A8H5ZYM5_PETAA|nr:hypothetical protein ETB97_005491 [Aspergillus burnettii]